MYSTSHSTKRFPTACRFFAQGNCRAGDECMFAHILPIQGIPSNAAHAVLFGDNALDEPIQHTSSGAAATTTTTTTTTTSDSRSIQRAIRDLELDQLEKKYKPRFHKPSSGPQDASDLLSVGLPLQDTHMEPATLLLDLTIPFDYPDTQCAIRIRNHDMPSHLKQQIKKAFEELEGHQQRHITLVQQLDWLSSSFPDLVA